MHIQLRQCTLQRVLEEISLVRIPHHLSKDSDSDSYDSESPEPSSRPEDERQLPSLAGLGWLHPTPAVAPLQSLHLPSLSIDIIHAVSFYVHTQRCQSLPSLCFFGFRRGAAGLVLPAALRTPA
jgi:hypothetical protein